MKQIPNHKHDCTLCTHLGSTDTTDYYYCKPDMSKYSNTLIARYGEDGDYSSGICFYLGIPDINIAGNLALDQGLITIEEINLRCPYLVVQRVVLPIED